MFKTYGLDVNQTIKPQNKVRYLLSLFKTTSPDVAYLHKANIQALRPSYYGPTEDDASIQPVSWLNLNVLLQGMDVSVLVTASPVTQRHVSLFTLLMTLFLGCHIFLKAG